MFEIFESIRFKLGGAIGALALIAILGAFLILNAFGRVTDRLSFVVDTSVMRIELANNTKLDLLAATRAQRNLIRSNSTREQDLYEQETEQLSANILRRRIKLRGLSDRRAQGQLDDFLLKWQSWLEIDGQVRELARLNSNIRASELASGRGQSAFDVLRVALDQVSMAIRDDFHKASRSQESQQLTLAGTKLQLVADLLRHLLEYQHAERRVFLASKRNEHASLMVAMDLLSSQVQAGFTALEELLGDSAKRHLGLVRAAYKEYDEVNDEVRRLLIENGNSRASELSQGTAQNLADECEHLLTRVAAGISASMANEKTTSDLDYRSTLLFVTLLGALALILGVGIAVWIARDIVHRLQLLVDYTRQLEASGDLEPPVPTAGSDELAELSGSMEKMRITMLDGRRELEDRVEDRTRVLSQLNRDLNTEVDERKATEQALSQSRERLRSLAARVLQVREDERGAISREIHDEFGQTLTALRMDLMWQINRLPKEDDELKKCAKSAVSTTDAMLTSVRRICSQLRPSLLDDLGLVAAIEWQAEEASKRSGFECVLSLDAPTLGSNDIRDTAVFRILQEALTNVARHADAKRVQIDLTQSGRELVLEVRDDGVGITEENLSRPGSLGLIGMRERAEANGGRVEIESATGGGTIVLLALPIEQPAVGSGME